MAVPSSEVFATAAFVARASHGKLVAHLARRWRDLEGAEDALAEAFASALEHWPRAGIPASPEGWLLTAARRALTDRARHERMRHRPDVIASLEREVLDELDPDRLPDDRLRLMFACAHPAIDAAVRPALVLQAVLGVEAKTMASAFLLSADTMNKRLVRAKAKIRAAGIRFEEPEASDLPERLHAVLEAIYAAYFLGSEGELTDGDPLGELRQEALFLAGLVADALPNEPEALGFRALVELCEARRAAQVGADDALVPLLEQDTTLWDHMLLTRGYEHLAAASRHGRVGPFQLEAAIQGAHCYRARAGVVPWAEIARLYEALVTEFPTVGAVVGMAVAVAHAETPAKGRYLLEQLPEDKTRDYQPWWVARSYLAELDGELDEARRCLERAVGLTAHPRRRRFLQSRLGRIRHIETPEIQGPGRTMRARTGK